MHRARDVLTGVQYAVKSLNKFTADGYPLDQRQKHFQRTEMQLHYEVSEHPNIVSLLRILDLQDCTLVVMEYCPEGDLFQSITEQGRYVGNDADSKAIFIQILDAVAHCHRLGVYHRDLKPENILVTDGGRQVKLADFGLATTDERSSDFGCGSTFYMSPECQNQASGTAYACAPNDIWSLGVILVNLTCGRNPWKAATAKDSTFKAYTEDRQFLKSILPLSDELNEILGMIFELDPTKRISLEELRQRILDCPAFTRQADQSVEEPIDEDFVDEDLLEDNPGISRSSTVSVGSSASDSSEDSDMASVFDEPEAEPVVTIMDEDSNYDDFQPTTQKELIGAEYCIVEPSHVAETPVDTTGMANLSIDHAMDSGYDSCEPTQNSTPKASSKPGYFASLAAPWNKFHKSVTPAQLSILNSTCAPSTGRRFRVL